MKLVPFIIGRCYGSTHRMDDDMMSVGYMALCYAALGYDPSCGVKFSTYAAKCIINELRKDARKVFKPAIQTGMAEISLNSKLSEDDEEELLDKIVDHDVNIEIDVIDEMDRKEYEEIAPLLFRRFVDGYSVSDIAKEHGISKQAISRKMSKEGRMLRHRLMTNVQDNIGGTAIPWTQATM